MATVVFTAIGTAIGGPLGGAIGSLIGNQVDRAVIGTPSREGPRLKELTVQTSSYGTSFPRVFGRMRLSGTVIWATDLMEHRSQSGGGKRSPKTTNYSYTASFAVALSSRPIQAVGRIWADGNLLRGVDGMLSAGGTMRIYQGHGDQLPDPLIAAAIEDGTGDGTAVCAFRGLAYAVFEDLPLGDFGNRIPSLSFEVIADTGDASLASLLENENATTLADSNAPAIAGFVHEGGSLADALAQFSIARPLLCRAVSGDLHMIYPPGDSIAPIIIPHDPVPPRRRDHGTAEDARGWSLERDSAPQIAPLALRYYDVARDYQIGLQRSLGPSEAAQPQQIELPAALDAAAARQMIGSLRDQSRMGAERLQWRMATLDPALAPGSVVRIAGRRGRWQVDAWEWVDQAIELTMQRIGSSRGLTDDAVDPGQALLSPDLPGGPTQIIALEQPSLMGAMIGTQQAGEDRALLVGASSTAAGWRGAEIFRNEADGSLASIGSVPSTRAVIGQSVGLLARASPMLIDTHHRLIVQLIDPQFQLVSTTPDRLSEGANLALLGEELLQFLHAEALGQGLWALTGLLRGRAGTETAIAGHLADEDFLLLDGLWAFPASSIPQGIGPASIAAIGQSDAAAVIAPLRLRGMANLPLAPCHARWTPNVNGGGTLSWTRRSRRGGLWLDGADAPLAEQAEQYLLEATFADGTMRGWLTGAPQFVFSAADQSQLAAPDVQIHLRQLGDGGRSPPLSLRIPTA